MAQNSLYCADMPLKNYSLTIPHPFYSPFYGSPGWASARRELLDFMVQGRLTEADTPTIRLGATPSGLTSAHLYHSPVFLQDGCPSCCPTNSVKAL